MSIESAFNSFLESSDFESAVNSSTKASWGGSAYSVELFEDGSFRVLWDQQIGNLYDSPGLILSIPILSDDEWSDDPSICYYENAKESIQSSFLMSITNK